jgi:hypothetical protein
MIVRTGSIDRGLECLCFGDATRYLMLWSVLWVCAKQTYMRSFIQ